MIVHILIGGGALAVGVTVWELLCRSKLATARGAASQVLEKARAAADAETQRRVEVGRRELEERKGDLSREREEGKERIARLERRIEDLERQLENRTERMKLRSKEVDTRKREFFQAQKDQRQRKRVLKGVKNDSRTKLCDLSELTPEQGQEVYLNRVDEALARDASRYLHLRGQALEEELDERSRRILSIAIQRCTFSHIVDGAVSVTRFTDPAVRNRVAGKGGAILKQIHKETSIEIIVDEANPDIFFYSGYDGVAREVVRRTIDKLVKTSGRIDPRMVGRYLKRFRKEVERQIFNVGRSAVNKQGLRRVHPELVNFLGRLQYRSSYGQNVLWHSIEVAYLAGLVASEVGLNRKLAKRGALLHDIGKAVSLEMEGGHPEIGAELARKYGEKDSVIQPIAMHHESTGLTQMTELTRIGDAISGSRPGARRDTSEKYLMRLEQIMGIVNAHPGIETSYSMQAGREIWVIVDSEKMSDEEAGKVCEQMASEIEENVTYPGKIKLTMIREARAVAMAR